VKRAAERTSSTVRPAVSNRDRLIRSAAFLACGPAFLLLTSIEPSVTSVTASLILSGSFLAAKSLPRLLGVRLGGLGGFFAASLVLGATGALIGVLDGCSVDPALCRYAVGVWMLVWMLFPSGALLAGLAVRFLGRSAVYGIGLLPRLYRRLRLRR
jgi:hypothetical protein